MHDKGLPHSDQGAEWLCGVAGGHAGGQDSVDKIKTPAVRIHSGWRIAGYI